MGLISALAATVIGAEFHMFDLASTTFFLQKDTATMRTAGILLLMLPGILHSQPADAGSSPPMMVIEMKPGDTHLDRAEIPGEGRLGRWIRLDASSVSSRYRHIGNFMGVIDCTRPESSKA
jgi:hypothetical protein